MNIPYPYTRGHARTHTHTGRRRDASLIKLHTLIYAKLAPQLSIFTCTDLQSARLSLNVLIGLACTSSSFFYTLNIHKTSRMGGRHVFAGPRTSKLSMRWARVSRACIRIAIRLTCDTQLYTMMAEHRIR